MAGLAGAVLGRGQGMGGKKACGVFLGDIWGFRVLGFQGFRVLGGI